MGGTWSVESWTGVAAKFRRRGLGTTRRSNDLQRRYKSYSLSGAAEGRLGEKYCFWFSPMYRTKVTHGCETRRWWMLMYSIKGIGVIWRNVVRGSSGCCEIRWKHASVGWLQSTNLLWRTYWIVDTIQSEFRPCPSHRRLSIKFQSTRCETNDSRWKETRGDEAFWNVSRDRGSTTIDQKLISKRSSKDSTALRKKTPGTISFLLD